MNWIIQDSNNQHTNWVRIYQSAAEVGDNVRFVNIDDNNELNRINEYSIVIGGDDFIDKCVENDYLSVGIIRDRWFFNIDNYISMFKTNYLNHDSKVMEFMALKRMRTSSSFFIRPYEDNKIFDGAVYSIDNFIRNNKQLSDNCKLAISSPKNIEAEWRLVVIYGNIVTGSSYVGEIELNDSVIEFAESCIENIITPDAYVVDVVLSGGKFKILECNTINSSNFYNCDIKKIVISMDELMINRIKNSINCS